MAKWNKKYRSLFGVFINLFKIRFGYLFGYTELFQPNTLTDQFKGSVQPLADIGKDFIDTFKPYRRPGQALRDFLQPLYGLGNVFKGLAYILLLVPLFLIGLVVVAFKADDIAHYFKLVLKGLSYLTTWFIDGIFSVIRGALQIATTPLTWFVKMLLLRGPITFFTWLFNEKALLIENRTSIKALVSKAAACEDFNAGIREVHCSDAIHEIHRKYQKGHWEGEATLISDTEEQSIYSEFQSNFSRGAAYVALFSVGSKDVSSAIPVVSSVPAAVSTEPAKPTFETPQTTTTATANVAIPPKEVTPEEQAERVSVEVKKLFATVRAPLQGDYFRVERVLKVDLGGRVVKTENYALVVFNPCYEYEEKAIGDNVNTNPMDHYPSELEQLAKAIDQQWGSDGVIKYYNSFSDSRTEIISYAYFLKISHEKVQDIFAQITAAEQRPEASLTNT